MLVAPVKIDSPCRQEAESGDPLSAAFMSYGPSCHTAGEISGWNRPHLDKDERNIVRRHRDKLE